MTLPTSADYQKWMKEAEEQDRNYVPTSEDYQKWMAEAEDDRE